MGEARKEALRVGFDNRLSRESRAPTSPQRTRFEQPERLPTDLPESGAFLAVWV